MVVKFVVFTVLCTALIQVRGENLQEQIKQGLAKLNSLNTGALKATEQTAKDVTIKTNVIKEKASIFLQKESKMSSEIIKSLEAIAASAEKKATENNRPPATFECIRKAKTEAITNIQGYGPKFEADIMKLKKTKLAAIETIAKPLETIPATLKEMYKKFESLIKGCKNTSSLEKVLQDMNTEFKTIFTKLAEIESQVGKTLSDFNRDANFIFSIVSRQENKIKADGAEAIKKC